MCVFPRNLIVHNDETHSQTSCKNDVKHVENNKDTKKKKKECYILVHFKRVQLTNSYKTKLLKAKRSTGLSASREHAIKLREAQHTRAV